ncbi:S9 family peptidase [Alkalihalobacillus oceani]|uniref:S9 family peptidase n=1 Tax=Halalkalibacter oceani TaxID=1653776 RepID=A0A9X2DPL0_9BACI|nr:S9 family peptidase [Halalkalibacter oceani]MCM3714744.1 S9 family peptidase [Halalkalibacter oceani]
MEYAVNEKRAPQPEEIARFTTVSDVCLSPDGKLVAYVEGTMAKREGVAGSRIMIADAEGQKQPQLLGDGPAKEPRWSRDGNLLAFITCTPAVSLTIINQLTNKRTDIAIPQEAQRLEWSPDGRFLSFLSRQPAAEATGSTIDVAGSAVSEVRLHLYCLQSGRLVSKTIARHSISSYTWSPDSRQLAVTAVASAEPNAEKLYVLTMNESQQRFLATVSDVTIQLAWSPDGQTIVWCGREHTAGIGQIQLFRLEADPVITMPFCADFPGSIKWIGFLRDGRLVFAALKQFRVGIYAVRLDGGRVETLVDPFQLDSGSLGSGSFSQFTVSVSEDGQRYATTCSGPAEPGNVVTGSWNVSPQRITDYNSDIKNMTLGEVEELSWMAPDGLDIHGLLIKPVDYVEGRSYPLVVEIHGGPRRSWWNTCYLGHSWAQLLANQGYLVLLPNPRGSSGRGAEFVRANSCDLGGADLADVLTGVDDMIARGYADPEQLGIAGWSYGGFLAAWAITQTKRFKAAVIGASIVNWISWQGQSAMARQWASIHWGNRLIAYQNPERLIKRSPIHFVQNVQTPSLLLHGEQDQKIPAAQADEFYAALKALNVPVDYVKYQGEGHVLTEEAHQIDGMKRVVGWFKRYLR